MANSQLGEVTWWEKAHNHSSGSDRLEFKVQLLLTSCPSGRLLAISETNFPDL